MKKNMLMIVAMLCAVSGALATVFYNETGDRAKNIPANDVIVVGFRGVPYPVKTTRNFELGLRDDLEIKVIKKAQTNEINVLLRFDLREVKKHFWFIDKAFLYKEGPEFFTLKLVGKPKGDPTNVRDALSRFCEVRTAFERCVS